MTDNKHNNKRKILLPSTPSISEQAAKSTQNKGLHPTVIGPDKDSRMNSGKTQGAKGCKLPRINLALTPDHYQFVRSLSGASGMSYSDFINAVLEEYKRNHPEAVELAGKLRDTMRGILTEDE